MVEQKRPDLGPGILEIVGLFVVVVGCGAIVAAASMVSTALAVLTAGALAVLGGVLIVYVATALERRRASSP